MAVYICSKCLFCFERSGEVDMCPNCSRINVRLASEKEIVKYNLNKDKSRDGRGVTHEEK